MSAAGDRSGTRGTLRRWLALGIILAACAVGFVKALGHPPPALFQAMRVAESGGEAPVLRGRFVSTRRGALAHAASLVEMRDGRIRAFWNSGSREGARDVESHSAVFDPRLGEWG